MTKRIFSNWLRSYVEYTAASEAPDIFHFWTGVSVIAGALRRRVWIEQRYFQWTPNFYIIFVAPPGIATKSTTVNLGLRLLRQVKGIKFGPDSVTWQRLLVSMQDAQELIPLGDKFLPMAPITCSVSELGTFLKPDDSDMVDVLTDMWDGRVGTWNRELKTAEGTQIENPWLNIIGATTPSWLENNFPLHLIGGGLTSRCIFVYADKKKHYVAYPAEIIDEAEFETFGGKLVHDLRIIASTVGEYKLSDEAKEWGTNWYEEHWNKHQEHLSGDRFAGYLARKQTHIHKLAMVLAASESNELIIQSSHIEAAAAIVTGLEDDMIKVFQTIGAVDQSRHIKEIIAFVKIHKAISIADLWRSCSTSMSRHDFKEALDGAFEAGYVSVQQLGFKRLVTLPGASAPLPHQQSQPQVSGTEAAGSEANPPSAPGTNPKPHLTSELTTSEKGDLSQ